MKFKIGIPKFPENLSSKYRTHFKSFSDYNYISGKFSTFKLLHFYEALNLSRTFLKKNLNAIDYGCSDGFFSFTLSNYFNEIIGIDINQDYLHWAEKIKKKNNIKNVQLINVSNMSHDKLEEQIKTKKISVIFCLEVIEHIFDKKNPYKLRIKKIKEMLNYLSDEGILIVSVPIMIGLSLMMQFFISRLIGGINREQISIKNLLKAGLLRNYKDLHQKNSKEHMGFNHKYLEHYLEKERIKIEKIRYIPFKLKTSLNFGVIYKIRKK